MRIIKMNFSFMTVSFPVDEMTFNEMIQLCDESYAADQVHYNKILNIPSAMNYEAIGFFILAYHDESDQLVGMASAIDLIGLNTYEWSLLVHPMFRKMGIGNTLYEVTKQSLEMRQSAGELALLMEKDRSFNKHFIERKGYSYSFSEVTLETRAEFNEVPTDFLMRPFESSDTEVLLETFMLAFGDTEEEALDLINFNTTDSRLCMWTAERNGQIVGTVTTRKEGEAQCITAFAVHPQFERQGNGTAMLQFVKNYAASNGEKLVILDVELENKQALSVYEKVGFSKSEQVDYYSFVGK